MPSSRYSSDTDVSRCAIADWASLTWVFRQRELPAALPPASPRGLEPGHGAFTDQLPLELGQRREDAQHETAGRGRGVDLHALAGEYPQDPHWRRSLTLEISQGMVDSVAAPDADLGPAGNGPERDQAERETADLSDFVAVARVPGRLRARLAGRATLLVR